MDQRSDAPFRNAKTMLQEIRSKLVEAKSETKAEKRRKKKQKKSETGHVWC